MEASERATFGRNNEDVLDESYRKAWKMDTSHFACQFDVVKTGILDIVHDQLLHYAKNTKNLEAHLYKLNVYGMSFATRLPLLQFTMTRALKVPVLSSNPMSIPLAATSCLPLL